MYINQVQILVKHGHTAHYMTMLGGPTTKHVHSDAISKKTGRYQNRQYAGLTLVGGDNAYVYTKITY